MSSRKSRLSLATTTQKDAKSPNTRRTPSRRAKAATALIASTATAGNEQPPTADECPEVSPSQGADYSPVVPFTQDAFHAINGVSWEWNSPQSRMRGSDSTQKHAGLQSRKTFNHSESPCSRIPKKATGYNKFISKLNLLLGKENLGDLGEATGPVAFEKEDLVPAEDETVYLNDTPDLSLLHDPFALDDVVPSGERKAAPAEADSDDDLFQDACIDSESKSHGEAHTDEAALDSEFDDSRLNSMLIAASQTIEQNLVTEPPSTSAVLSATEPTDAIDSATKIKPRFSVAPEMNDSDIDCFLVQASLMAEDKPSDRTQEACKAKSVSVESIARKEPSPSASEGDHSHGSSGELTMSQEEIKALIEKKRQEALRRLQNSRLKRAMIKK
ncbi:uncharacterized protein LOC118456828 [Anopheles albimanus]|uniref:Uncharacterized protein n=1 Tax=Anopheles albimanus TaxID=7167 RepID=A0A182FQN6_ANOAL|nr:uncharacterized protein LOC118456828 [Anopheles albimanus]